MSKIILTVLILASLALFLMPLRRRLQIIGLGSGALSVDPIGPRIGRWLSEVLFQSKVIRERPFPGLMHAFVFWGFVAFGLETLDHFAEGFGGSVLGHGPFRTTFSWIVALFALAVLIGIVALFIRRFVFRPRALGKLSPESGLVALFIVVLMLTYLLPQLGMFEPGTTAARVNWWIHTLVILTFLPVIVQSKHLHLVLSPFTTFLKDFELARVRTLDFEKEEFGAEKLTDLHKHTILGAFTCVECGRCQDNCPAFNTGKLLNPKTLMLDLERGLLADPGKTAVADDLVKEEVLWQCTTCGACTYQCPVGIDQVVPIIDLRRGLVANGSFPDTFKSLFKNLENAGNPWGYPAHEGEAFLEQNGYPAFSRDQHDVLYWVGCLGRYEDRYRKVSQAFAQVLGAARVKWGVLTDERCTGDAARRAGNEFLFSMLAEQNIEALNAAGPSRIVATCPHCVRTLEEYRDFGLSRDIEILHHSTLIEDLIAHGGLRLQETRDEAMTVYHDPCYLSRYREPGGVTEPRHVLRSAGAKLVEPERAKTGSFCCGAGGAMVFAEETEGTRVNHERVDELIRTGAGSVAIACPFCRIMVSDGLADKGREGIAVKDIAQIVAEKL